MLYRGTAAGAASLEQRSYSTWHSSCQTALPVAIVWMMQENIVKLFTKHVLGFKIINKLLIISYITNRFRRQYFCL